LRNCPDRITVDRGHVHSIGAVSRLAGHCIFLLALIPCDAFEPVGKEDIHVSLSNDEK